MSASVCFFPSATACLAAAVVASSCLPPSRPCAAATLPICDSVSSSFNLSFSSGDRFNSLNRPPYIKLIIAFCCSRITSRMAGSFIILPIISPQTAPLPSPSPSAPSPPAALMRSARAVALLRSADSFVRSVVVTAANCCTCFSSRALPRSNSLMRCACASCVPVSTARDSSAALARASVRRNCLACHAQASPSTTTATDNKPMRVFCIMTFPSEWIRQSLLKELTSKVTG